MILGDFRSGAHTAPRSLQSKYSLSLPHQRPAKETIPDGLKIQETRRSAFRYEENSLTTEFPAPQLVATNGIELALYHEGSGPPVVLLHGFPELAYSWRHQLPALAAAGYHALAPDQRGYGLSSKPPGVSQYTVQALIADVAGLLSLLGLDKAMFVGHDWGALILWYMAQLRPDLMSGLIALNVPFYPRPPTDPIALARARFGDKFYIVNFQDSDEADRRFAADVPHFFGMVMRRGQITRERFNTLPRERQVLSLLDTMDRRESSGEKLLTEAELAVYVDAFTDGGFTGPINWYRNWSHNWASTEGVGQTIDLPVLFIGAADDILISPAHIDAMANHVTDLETHVIADCGHWTQQERPDEVNRLMLDWLARRYPAG